VGQREGLEARRKKVSEEQSRQAKSKTSLLTSSIESMMNHVAGATPVWNEQETPG